MKKLFILVTMFFFAATVVTAQEWVGVGKNTPVKIQESLVSSSENEIVVDVKVGGFFQEMVKTPKGNQMIISGEDMASMSVKGAPNLPMYPISMLIGDKAEMEVSVEKSSYVDFENVEIAPSKGNFSRQINPDDVPYTYGEMYQQDAFYPAEQAALETPYIIRDFRGQNIMVYPYAYNPVTKTLRVYTDLRISAKKVSDNGENQKVRYRKNNAIDPEVNASYKRRFINYPTNEKYAFLEDEGEMLIICVDEYIEELKPLVEWKNMSGRPTTMVATSDAGILDDMKRFISNYYAKHPNLTYVLLVGEYENLPPYTIVITIDGLQYSTKSDNYYGMLEGDDFYEEVFIGRLSAASKEDATNQVNKIIYYERDIDESATWLTRGIGIGSTEGYGHFGEKDYQHIDFIRDTLMNYTYTEISQRYDGVNGYVPVASDFSADFNKGLGIANYCNHGEQLKWVLGDFDIECVHNLTNDYMLPFIWSSACYNGQFDNTECFAESWMRAMNPVTGAPTGAIGGMFSWISQPWQPPMYGQDEMVAILTEWRDGYKHTLGGASLNGNMCILDKAPDDNGNTHNTWMLFGDPSLMLRTKAPEKMSVYCSSSYLLVGMSSFSVNADVAHGIATLSKDGEMLASSYIKDGHACLSFPALEEEGKLKLVVLAYNKVTKVLDIEVKSATDAFVIFNEYELNEEDGQLDYAEEIDLSLNVKNIGAKGAENINVELISNSDYVEIVDAKATISSIAINEVVDVDKKFKFNVAGNVPNQERLDFEVKCSSAGDSWLSGFSITANAPELVVDTAFIKDESIEPGTNATLVILVRNEGDSDAKNVVAELFSSSSDIVFAEPTITTESLQVGEVFEIVANFNVEETAKNGSIYEVIYTVSAGAYNVTSNYFITVGLSFEGFETGNFLSIDWQFEGDNAWIISQNAYEGSYCARSGKIADSQQSSMFVVVDLPTDTEISFYYKTACDYYDRLHFYVDDKEVERWNGNNKPTAWEKASYVIPSGTHTLKWMYKKDKFDSFSDDCVYIDNIVLPPLNVVNSLASVKNLAAKDNSGVVTLSWDANQSADEYIIKRDGEQLAVQTETTYTDILTKEGVYTYSVIAKKGSSQSLPAFVTVKVSTVGIDEIQTNDINIYPNPATDVIYVDMEESFDAIIYNYQGQVVKTVKVENSQINVSELSYGIYFVEIRTQNNVAVKKVVVE